MQLHAAHSAHRRACQRTRDAADALLGVPVLLRALLGDRDAVQLTIIGREELRVAASDEELLAPALALAGDHWGWTRSCPRDAVLTR